MIKNNIRPRASSERLDKLAAMENSNSLEWIMKNSQMIELKSNIKMIPKESLSLNIHIPEHEGIATIWADKWFGQKKISQFRGLLIYDNQFCLVLNDCFIEKKRYQSSHFRAYYIKLINPTGQLVLIFSHPLSLKQWSSCIKKYCKRNNFYKKYKVHELICQNFYGVQHKKSKKMFTAQVINLSTIQNYEQAELLDNYLKILRNSTIPNYIQTIGVFEEKSMMFIVGKLFKGNSLDQILSNGKKSILSHQEIATMAANILLALKALQEEELFHGKISFENIICFRTQKLEFGSYLVNSLYKQYDGSNLESYTTQMPQYLIAPEISTGSPPSVQTDIYQLGVVLGLVTFAKLNSPCNSDFFENQSQQLNSLIVEQEQAIIKEQGSKQYPHLFSISQLDLIKKMIHPNANQRISVNDALKHVWLINIKEKKFNRMQTKTAHFPSLRTIIEIKDSECEIKKTLNNFQDDGSSFQMNISPDPISLWSQKNKQQKYDSETFVDFNDEDENMITEKIQQLNQQQYQLVPSLKDHAGMYRSKKL